MDPLAHAVENAWRAGIVVVAAAGNDGLAAPSLLMPAVDPNVLAVGASDQMGTDVLTDDVVADFTSGGSDARRPDVVAPGRSVVSLRVPGSYVDTMSPEGRVEGDATARYFRGSGTSQATAFVAGEVALLLDARPQLTPGQVKSLLVSTARPLSDGQPAQGAGMTDLRAAAAAPVPASVPSSLPVSLGTGSLEQSRGGEHLVDPLTGAVLTGEVDVLGDAWDPATWAVASSTGESWNKGMWNGRTWTGAKFKDKVWAFAPWSGTSWGALPWTSYQQSAAQWVARSWRGDNWEARSWREESWLARSWRSLY
jgi:serine protease AprX